MERKNIAFQYGITRSPSAATDGELSECINMEVHHGELTPSVMPEVAFTLSEGDKLLFVHKTGSYKNYIIQRGDNLCWFPDEDRETVTEIGEITPTSIHSVGNTLVVLSEDNMEYILYKSNGYKRIGNKPPFCCISFGLKNVPIISAPSNQNLLTNSRPILFENYPDLETSYNSYKAGDIEELNYNYEKAYNDAEDGAESFGHSEAVTVVNKLTEEIHGYLNPLKQTCKRKGYFYDSFFIRYAYRLYDGSHYMQSAPVFFPINTEGPALILPGSYASDGISADGISLKIGLNACRISYKICGLYNEDGQILGQSLVDWQDIIEGIDIFVTPQITRFYEDNKVWGISTKAALSDSICYVGRDYTKDKYSAKSYSGVYSSLKFIGKEEYLTLDIELSENEDYTDKIKNSSSFYKIASFDNLNSIVNLMDNERELLDIKENTLTNLEQQEALDDDYDSHNKIIPSFAHVYNGRLNVSGIKTKIFSGFPLESMVPYTYHPDGTNYRYSIRTKLEIEGEEIEVVAKSHMKLLEKPAFIYYPSTKVKEFTIYKYDNSEEVVESFSSTHSAETHKLLNGSFYLSESYGIDDSYTFDNAANPIPSGNPFIAYPNKLYTSEVNNPFFFPLSGRNSIGTGEIIAITSNTKAISPGQFGQYPLIVFSTDGVWAMQTGEEGLYYSVHPITKDICSNPNVLQTDGPVLFATSNGIHSITGETIVNISSHLKGNPEILTIPEVNEAFTALVNAAEDEGTFNQFIQEATFAYDYANSRVLAYNKEKPFAYIISSETGAISKLVLIKDGEPVSMESSINAYPEVYMQSGNDIYTFVPDTDNTEQIATGVIVTRPLSLDDPLAMKVINDTKLIYRRTSEKSKCRYAIMVSNDGYRWAFRHSLRGHSFKFFRFVIYTEMKDTDALQGMSVMFDYRRTHKLR